MSFFLALYLISVLRQTQGAFFHELSYVSLQPIDKQTYDFGSTINLFEQSLIVGAPHANLNGVVYTCPLHKIPEKNTVLCSNSGIDIEKYAPKYNRTLYPKQPFCLGGSLATTKTYFIACAPLWAKSLWYSTNKSLDGAFGTCFTSTGKHILKYNGLLEHYEQTRDFNLDKALAPNLNDIYGPMGSTVLADEDINIIVFSKPMDGSHSRIGYLPIVKPSAFIKKTNLLNTGIDSYRYKGRAMVSGVFFKDYNKIIAFSMENDRRKGAVGFLQYSSTNNLLSVITVRKRATLFKADSIGSMYGAALHAAYLTGDSYSDLLVGAPGQACNNRSFEVGAVHIYEGGEKARDRTIANLYICGTEDGSRFGTSITSVDLDEDNIPEIIISAPYESAGRGTVYIISGYEVRQVLIKKKSIQIPKIFIKDFTTKQEIKSENFKTFGYSLQVLPHFKTQLNGLAVGCPDSEQVVIYRSIPSIIVVVTSELAGKQIVRESDSEFTVAIRVNVTYPTTVNVTAKLLVKASLVSNIYAEIKSDNTYLIDLSSLEPSYTKNITVALLDNNLHTYKFKAEATLIEDGLKSTVYNTSLVRLSQYSKLTAVQDIQQTCDDDVCRPRLSVTFDWIGRTESYTLGSSEEETISVVVQNDGNSSDVSCVWIHVTGAPIAVLKCDEPEKSWYRCDLLTIGRHDQRYISITLDMKRPISTDKELRIDVLLYDNCPSSRIKSDYKMQSKIVPYILNATDIHIDGFVSDQNITDTKLQKAAPITISKLFTIKNTGTVLWKTVLLQLIADEHIFLENFQVYSPDFEKCEKDTLTNFTYNCVLDLKPLSSVRIRTTTQLLKTQILNNLKDNKIMTTTTLLLKLSNNLDLKNKTVSGTLFYNKDIETFGQNETKIIVSSCVIAAFILGLIIFGLYKIGFFKRKGKKKLQNLKSSIRRPPPPSENATAGASAPQDNTELEIADSSEDILMQNLQHDVRDEKALIEATK